MPCVAILRRWGELGAVVVCVGRDGGEIVECRIRSSNTRILGRSAMLQQVARGDCLL